jgi:hypothetical protein
MLWVCPEYRGQVGHGRQLAGVIELGRNGSSVVVFDIGSSPAMLASHNRGSQYLR